MNVGFGEASVIRAIGDGCSFCMVVDAGDGCESIYRRDARRCSLEQYLQEEHIARIDIVVLTHCHKDHIGGLYSVLGKVPIDQIIVNARLPEQIMKSNFQDDSTSVLASLSLYSAILKKADELEIPTYAVEAPAEIHRNGLVFKLATADPKRLQRLKAELAALNMERLEQEAERLRSIDSLLNFTALAVLVSGDDRQHALITSDTDLEHWKQYDALLKPTGILQAPHHGDIHYISEAFIERLSPRYVIVSADSEGTYQLPHGEEVETLIAAHSEGRIYYTEGRDTVHRMIRIDLTTMELNLIR